MTTSELKLSIVENVLWIADWEILKDINLVLILKINSNNEPEMSAFQKKRLEESIKQAERGEFKSNEEVFKEIELLLKK